MWQLFIVIIVISLCRKSTFASQDFRTHDTHDFFALHLVPSSSPQYVVQLLGVHYEGPIGELAGHYKFSVRKENSAKIDDVLQNAQTQQMHRKRNREQARYGHQELHSILWGQKLRSKEPLQKEEPPPLEHLDTSHWVEDPFLVQMQDSITAALGISDPLFRKQWHLFNNIQRGEDMNVTGLWLEGVTGRGIATAIIDNGLDIQSEDLKENYFPQGSFNFNEKTNDPRPKLPTDTHGTRCAGEIAAGKNNLCGIGMAYESKIAGIRLLSGQIDESDEAAALNYHFQDNHIYSCSWGPPDTGEAMGGPGLLVQRALINGVQNGRRGKGSIFIFAAGNGGFLGDNCNFDGYANSVYSVAVGAITREGQHAEYSEPCAAQLVVAYSSGGYKSEDADAISTTDVGVNSCTAAHGGTSAAGPLVAGALALALSVRPALGWRDVQYILRETAVPILEEAADWQVTKTGKKFSHMFGFGKVDTYALVQKAKDWDLVKPQAWYHSPQVIVNEDIPQGSQGLESNFEITREIMQNSNLARLEHVTVTINVRHDRRGDLSVELHSPDGVISYLSTNRKLDNERSGYVDWTFMSVAHWGEFGIGTWKVIVKDTQVNNFSGIFENWNLNLWGEAIDSSSQPLHPLPDMGSTNGDVEIPSLSSDYHEEIISEISPGPLTSASGKISPTSSFFVDVSPSARLWSYTLLSLGIFLCIAAGAFFYLQKRKQVCCKEYRFELIRDGDEACR